jgi:hypothetical protein
MKEDNRPIIGTVINKHGEIGATIKQGDRIISGKSLEASRTKKIREYESIKSGKNQEWNLEHFFKGHIPEIRELMKTLSVYEKSFLFSIATYVGYEDCCLKHDNGVCLDFEELVDISGMSRGMLHKVLTDLKKADIIYKGTNSKGFQYFINPWIYCKGVRINVVLKTMFKNYHIRVMGGTVWGSIPDAKINENLNKKLI